MEDPSGPVKVNGDITNEIIANGPLEIDELRRRGQVTIYNELADMYRRYVDTCQDTFIHPETRQVSAQVAKQLFELANTLELALPEVKSQPLVVHFLPYGSYETVCDLQVPKGSVLHTSDRRKETTCPECLAKFTDTEEKTDD